jgi:hypothetical protein
MHRHEHPLICLYGRETEYQRFPLVMFVGREPNNDVSIIDKVGKYDFDEAPRCGFWNMAYKIIAEFGPKEAVPARYLKDICRQQMSSPVAFTDLSPQPILQYEKNKQRERLAIPWCERKGHIDRIFCKSVIARVELFVLAGLDGKEFENSKKYFVKKCAGQHVVEVPFLYPANYPRIREAFNKENAVREHARHVYQVWHG